VAGAKDLGKNGYKIQLSRVAVKRAILQAVHGKPGIQESASQGSAGGAA